MLFTVAECIDDRWVVRPMFGEFLLTGNSDSNVTEAVALLETMRRAVRWPGDGKNDFHRTVRTADYHIGVFYVPNPRLDAADRQILVCGRTDHYRVFPVEFPSSGGAAAPLFRDRRRSFPPIAVRPANAVPDAHCPYFRAVFDVRLPSAGPVPPRTMTVGWVSEYDAIRKLVDIRDRKCANIAGCDIVRALRVVRQKCWQPSNCGVIRYIASTIHPRDATVSVFTDWYALGDMYQSRHRFSVAERSGIFIGALQGIRFLNRTLAFLHNDIKPENVFVGIREGRCVGVIGDIARAVP